MKKILILALLILPISIFAQSEIEKIVREGIALHDASKYDEAIEVYNKALAIDKKSSLVHYEIGFSYFAKGAHKKAIKHMDKVIKNGDKFLKEAYMTKGSSLDVLGKSKDAIKVYEKAIKEFPDNYLLHYNLALTQYNTGKQDEAEQNLIDAVTLNPTHGTSNYLLGLIKLNQGKRVEPFLALHFFLLIEPSTGRSKDALALLKETMGQGVKQKDDKNIEINLNPMELDGEFASSALMLSLMAASNMTEENEGKSSQQLFYENTESMFSVLKETKKDQKGIWWDLYINYFSGLADSGHLEAYCYFISQSNSDLETKWMDGNEEKMNAFYGWLKE